jgi:hypothetical protein
MEKKKIMAKELTLLVTVASLLAVLVVGSSIAAAVGVSTTNHNSGSSKYKQPAWTKSLNLVEMAKYVK